MKSYTKQSLIDELIKIRNQGWIQSGRPGNDGGVGNTLEDLLGIEENNLPIPNAAEWELKTQKKNTNALITLFHMEPSPRAYRFVPQVLLPNFGWPHKGAGSKYPSNELSFRQTIQTRIFSNRGFSVKVDADAQRVEIVFDSTKIDKEQHSTWYEKVKNKTLIPTPYWGYVDLFHKAGTKLHNCFFVQATTKKINGQDHFRYENIFMLKNLCLEKFIAAIEDGMVYIDFDARTGHNHGTKFRLTRETITSLFFEVKEY